ncbi:MAG: D-amino-acid transaminase [Sneathiellales bacterium]|nr:D-amino-acid transaminase [Sneathiellales bacterium]
MKQIYLNGRFVEQEKAVVSVFDRGFLFADAIYEVTAVVDGKPLDLEGHMDRLGRSLEALGMKEKPAREYLQHIHQELIRRNRLQEGIVYLQISRGTGSRDFIYPSPSTSPTVVAFVQEKKLMRDITDMSGLRVITVEDKRWGRCDIKTTQLLYPSMARNTAVQSGADDAWFVKDGYITEGVSSNAYIINREGVLITRQIGEEILGGVTRAALMHCAQKYGLVLEERPFTVEEAKKANEAFSTSSPTFVNPVVEIDGQRIGSGLPGEITRALHKVYLEKVLREAS